MDWYKLVSELAYSPRMPLSEYIRQIAVKRIYI